MGAKRAKDGGAIVADRRYVTMRRKTLIATIFAALATLGACAAFAHGAWGRHRFDPDQMQAFASKRLDHVLDELEATPAQREQLYVIRDRLLGSAKTFFAGRDSLHQAFVEAIASDEKPDAAELHALVDQRFDEMRKLAHEAVDGAIEAHGILTPEQRRQVAEHLQNHGPRR
jgi:Spy/CpxP family protein refolding chaperone